MQDFFFLSERAVLATLDEQSRVKLARTEEDEQSRAKLARTEEDEQSRAKLAPTEEEEKKRLMPKALHTLNFTYP